MKQITKATAGAKIHPSMIFPKTAQFILATPFKIEMPIIAPTTAWELETGTNGIVGNPRLDKNVSRPRDANINKTIECDITAIKAVVAERLPSWDPTVSITFRE